MANIWDLIIAAYGAYQANQHDDDKPQYSPVPLTPEQQEMLNRYIGMMDYSPARSYISEYSDQFLRGLNSPNGPGSVVPTFQTAMMNTQQRPEMPQVQFNEFMPKYWRYGEAKKNPYAAYPGGSGTTGKSHYGTGVNNVNAKPDERTLGMLQGMQREQERTGQPYQGKQAPQRATPLNQDAGGAWDPYEERWLADTWNEGQTNVDVRNLYGYLQNAGKPTQTPISETRTRPDGSQYEYVTGYNVNWGGHTVYLTEDEYLHWSQDIAANSQRVMDAIRNAPERITELGKKLGIVGTLASIGIKLAALGLL